LIAPEGRYVMGSRPRVKRKGRPVPQNLYVEPFQLE
jgi:hypothetical protein